jgi:hypothetical protein
MRPSTITAHLRCMAQTTVTRGSRGASCYGKTRAPHRAKLMCINGGGAHMRAPTPATSRHRDPQPLKLWSQWCRHYPMSKPMQRQQQEKQKTGLHGGGGWWPEGGIPTSRQLGMGAGTSHTPCPLQAKRTWPPETAPGRWKISGQCGTAWHTKMRRRSFWASGLVSPGNVYPCREPSNSSSWCVFVCAGGCGSVNVAAGVRLPWGGCPRVVSAFVVHQRVNPCRVVGSAAQPAFSLCGRARS